MAEAERIYYPYAPHGKWENGHQGVLGGVSGATITLDDPDQDYWQCGSDPDQYFKRGSLNRYELDIPKGSTILGVQISWLNVADPTQIPGGTRNWSACHLITPGLWQNEYGFSAINYPDPYDLWTPYVTLWGGLYLFIFVAPDNHVDGLMMHSSYGGGYTSNTNILFNEGMVNQMQAWVDSDNYNPLTKAGRTVGLSIRNGAYGKTSLCNLEKPFDLTSGPSLLVKYEAPIVRSLKARGRLVDRVKGLVPAQFGDRVKAHEKLADRVAVSGLSTSRERVNGHAALGERILPNQVTVGSDRR